MPTLDDLAGTPNKIAHRYARFRVGERLLLTGHSHQAWPDVAYDGHVEAWEDAARLVDAKWARAVEKMERVRSGFAALLGAPSVQVALAPSTHELVTRFLSALPLRERPRLVTTDGEFHTIRRQLDRLAEERVVEVVKVPSDPADEIGGRLIEAVDARTAAVLTSSVLFANARIVPDLGAVLRACRGRGAELLVDAYHHLNVIPFSTVRDGLEDAFVVGGGYKYCQLGEGNCFLRVPAGRDRMRPVFTGWFSEFAKLTDTPDGSVPYGDGPARWAGATYDPTSHYRAARVFEFFADQGLAPKFLRRVSQHQIGLLAQEFDRLDLDPRTIARQREVPLDRVGGFLALVTPHAAEIGARLADRGVLTDHRGDVLRLGPAPYLNDQQLETAMARLGEVVRSLPKSERAASAG